LLVTGYFEAEDCIMKSMRFLLIAAALVVGLGLASSASAQCGGYGVGNCSFGNLNAFGSSGTLYGSGYLPVPPYYAIHPPVYYSHAYYRPYGWSPFAQPGYIAPAALRPEPRMIVNPMVPRVKANPAVKDESNTARSELIVNPFFVQGQKTGEGRLASSDSR
jgi:hypothetical protein